MGLTTLLVSLVGIGAKQESRNKEHYTTRQLEKTQEG